MPMLKSVLSRPWSLSFLFLWSLVSPIFAYAEMNVTAEMMGAVLKVEFPTSINGNQVEMTIIKNEIPQKLELKYSSEIETTNTEGVKNTQRIGEMKVVVFHLPYDFASIAIFQDSQSHTTDVYFSTDTGVSQDIFKDYAGKVVSWLNDHRAIVEKEGSLYVLPRKAAQPNILESTAQLFKSGVLQKKAVIDQLYKNKLFIATSDNSVSFFEHSEKNGEKTQVVAVFSSFYEYKQAPQNIIKSIAWVNGADVINKYREGVGILMNQFSENKIVILPSEITEFESNH